MKQLVIVGGGHSHIEVLRQFAENPPDVKLTVVSSESNLVYTGMLPGVVAGIYRHDECLIDIERLANRAGATWRPSAATSLDPTSNTLHLADGSRISYDILSLNIGAIPPYASIQGACEHMVPIKPMNKFLDWWDALLATGSSALPTEICIVGAGAGGAELALAIEARLRKLSESKWFGRVFLITDGNDIMLGHNRLVRRWLRRILEERNIVTHTNARVTSVDARQMNVADGRQFPFDHAIWTTGAAPEPWLSNSGLATDARGFVAVNGYLQSTSHPNVFASGDVATQVNSPRPKAGVYAVRQGPVLIENLRRAVNDKTLASYQPQRHALALIGIGERYAVASRGLLAIKGEWVWRWKEKIDREFVASYRPILPPTLK
ncbi:MAG TPA: FAD-dependent oxidoreductase [Burkholderiales bacterium]|nr:FAD-dependent oxidoreductase [Burkholderiales bacterium]